MSRDGRISQRIRWVLVFWLGVHTPFIYGQTAPASTSGPTLSRTSIYAAIHRAIGARNHDVELRNPDHMAEQFLGIEERALMKGTPWGGLLDVDTASAFERLREIGDLGSHTGILVRTKHIDAELKRAVGAGVSQVIVLGAGFDSRAYRFADSLQQVRVFELDLPATQEHKKRRVAAVLGALPNAARVTYVPIDFATQDLAVTLQGAGYSPADRAFFIWEGVTYYLPGDAVDATLRFVARHAAPGSAIVFDYKTESGVKRPTPFHIVLAIWGEPWIFGLPDGQVQSYVRGRGLDIDSDVDGETLTKLYATKTDGSRPFGTVGTTIMTATVR